MTRPLLCLATLFGCGCAAGAGLSVAVAAGLVATACLLAGLAVICRSRASAASALGCAALALGAADAAAARVEYESASVRALLGEEAQRPVLVQGVAHADSRERDGRTLLQVDLEAVDGVATTGNVRITVGGESSTPVVLQGERVSLWSTLGPPRGFDDPGVPDVRETARRDGWQGSGYCESGRLVSRAGPGTGVSGWAGRLRQELRGRLVAHVPAGPEQAVVRAMVLGDRTGLERETEDAFRIAGTYHVLALSGAQIALVAAVLLWPLRYLLAPPWLRALLVSSLLAAYAVLVGGDVPIVRAALMASVVLAGQALDLDSDTANLLGAAALLVLVARPGDWSDIGFQLSFAATLGLVLLTPALVARLPRLPLRLELALATSVAAQLALLPLLALHFHRIAPAALVLNLVAVPLSTAVLLAGVAVLAASALAAPLAAGLGWVAFAAARGLLASGTVVEGLPFLDARVPSPPVWWMVAHAAGLACLARGRLRPATAIVTAAAALAAVVHLAGPSGDGTLTLTVLDVGQGDSLVLSSPRGRTMLVDTGGSFDGRLDIGERVLGPYLWSRGVRRLAPLVLTHAHPDHAGSVDFIVRAFGIDDVWEGLGPRSDRGYAQLDGSLRRAGVPRRALTRGAWFDWDGVRIDVLGPRAHPPPAVTRNDDSLVLRVRLGEVSLLLAGDVEGAGEAWLDPGPLSVLKVAHHGSRTSSGEAFLTRTRPRVAITSSGSRNPFGHPHPEVVERLRSLGALVFRTDLEGAVTVTTDGQAVWVRSQALGPVRVQ